MKEIENRVEYVSVDKLSELPGNPRRVGKEMFEKLKKSIADNPDYFEARPVVVSDRTGELVILAGNQRYKASKELGLTEIPCVVLHGLSEKREREIAIRDNVENGDWDYDMLSNWDADELQEWGLGGAVKRSIEDEKDIENNPPSIVTSFITFDYEDTIELAIKDETAEALMDAMLKFKDENGTYNGFWDETLCKN